MPQPYIDVTGATAYRDALGEGTLADPYIPKFNIVPAFSATSTLTSVSSSATSVILLSANSARRTIIILNDSTADLYVTLNSSAASTANYSIFLAGKVGNIPSFVSLTGADYSGQINGIWVGTLNGAARITVITQ
jgi:hypothetical protein